MRSKATSPHTLVVLEADYENVERTRRSEGKHSGLRRVSRSPISLFIARATVEALHEWPNLNASVGDDALIVHHGINVGVAVDLDHQGLIVPVVHGAEELTLRGMARRIRDVSTRARSKQLSAQDISGGTFTLTNAGPFGTFLTAPIINQPQVGILSTDGVKRRPVVVAQDDGNEAIAIHSIGFSASHGTTARGWRIRGRVRRTGGRDPRNPRLVSRAVIRRAAGQVARPGPFEEAHASSAGPA